MLKTIAPGSPSVVIARSSSATDARRIVERQRRERGEASRDARRTTRANASLTVRAQRDRDLWRFDVDARRREGQELRRDAVLVQDPLPVVDVAVPGDEDVVVARVVHARIAVAS